MIERTRQSPEYRRHLVKLFEPLGVTRPVRHLVLEWLRSHVRLLETSPSWVSCPPFGFLEAVNFAQDCLGTGNSTSYVWKSAERKCGYAAVADIRCCTSLSLLSRAISLGGFWTQQRFARVAEGRSEALTWKLVERALRLHFLPLPLLAAPEVQPLWCDDVKRTALVFSGPAAC